MYIEFLWGHLLKNVHLEDTEGDVKVEMGLYGDRGSGSCPMSGFCAKYVELQVLLLPQLDDMSNVQLWIQLTWQNEQYFSERE
jgi:hypothetical protein